MTSVEQLAGRPFKLAGRTYRWHEPDALGWTRIRHAECEASWPYQVGNLSSETTAVLWAAAHVCSDAQLALF